MRITRVYAAKTPRLPVLAVAIAIFAGACEDDFSPYNRLDKLRVLAIRSEPVAPESGQTTVLTPLVYAPPSEAVSLAWSWCPFAGSADDGYPCLIDESQLAVWGGSDAVLPRFDLGTGDSATFANTFAPAFLRQLCSGEIGGVRLPEIPDCSDGFPVLLKLIARTATDEVTAIRPLRLRFEAAREPDMNPSIGGLTVLARGQTQAVDDVGSAIVPRGLEIVLNLAVAESAAEHFTTRDEGGQLRAERERLFFTWFVDTGKTKHQRTSFIADIVSLDGARENRWTIPRIAEDPRDEARLILVARDSRGGVGWWQGRVALEVAP